MRRLDRVRLAEAFRLSETLGDDGLARVEQSAICSVTRHARQGVSSPASTTDAGLYVSRI